MPIFSQGGRGGRSRIPYSMFRNKKTRVHAFALAFVRACAVCALCACAAVFGHGCRMRAVNLHARAEVAVVTVALVRCGVQIPMYLYP